MKQVKVRNAHREQFFVLGVVFVAERSWPAYECIALSVGGKTRTFSGALAFRIPIKIPPAIEIRANARNFNAKEILSSE